MKIKILISIILFLSTSLAFSQPQLTYRVTNPRIFWDAGDGANYLEFDVEVKASVNGTWAKALQTNFYYNDLGLASIVGFQKKGISAKPKFGGGDCYNIITSIASNKLNIYVTATTFATPATITPAMMSRYWQELTTSWQTLLTIRLDLFGDPDAVAGLFFSRATMNNQQFYQEQVANSTNSIMYSNPCAYDTLQSLKDVYLGRLYSSYGGWTQQNATNSVLDWSTPVSTSVWDTTASAAQLSVPGAITNGLRIHPTARLKVMPGASLTCSGATEINEPRGLVIGDNTGMAQFLDNGTITYNTGGTAQAFVKFAQDQWHYYTIPVQSTLSRPYAKMYMKYYQEPTDHWKYVMAYAFSPDTTLNTPMQGYAMWAASSGTYINPGYAGPSGLLNTGLASYSVTRNPMTGPDPFNGWNLIGNPYPSAIDLSSASVNWGNTEQTVWVWNPGGNYLTYIKGGSGTKTTSFVAAQQGFFVHHTVADVIPTTFSLTNAVRTINAEPFLKTATDFADLLDLEVSTSAGLMDKAVIRLAPDASYQYEESVDASKLWGLYEAPQLYSILPEEQYLTVNVLPWAGDSQVVPMGFSCGVSGDFKITASNLESFGTKHVYLEDKETARWQELSINPVYTFHYEAGEDQGRFVIHFMAFPLGTNNLEATTMKIWSNEENLYVMNVDNTIQKGKVELFDMTGRKVFAADLMTNKVSKYNPNVVEAYYAVKVTTQSGTYSQKVYLR